MFQPRPSAAQEPGGAARRTPAKLQELVDHLKARLSIREAVRVLIVSTNTRVVSVEAPAEADSPFQLAIEDVFLDALSDDELVAAIAHELGHVWVFTHHPYLQTERLANEIALRVVSRDSLARVYAKVWEREGSKGDLQSFLGPE